MKEKITVTGGNGFIGRHIAEALQKANFYVTVIDKKTSPTVGDSFIKADIADSDKIKIPKCKAVIHAAASLAQDKTAITVNCLGTYHALKLSAEYAEKFIYISSVPVIGKPENIPVTENHAVNPNTVYHVSKYCGELLCQLPEFQKLNPVIFRIASPIGIGMPDNRILTTFLRACLNKEPIKMIGMGKREQNYIDVNDISSAVLSAIKHENTNGLFLLSGHTISNAALAGLCCAITQSYPPLVYLEASDPQEADKWQIDASRAEKELKFTPQISLEQSILNIVRALQCE